MSSNAVNEFMTKDLLTIHEGAPLLEAYELMHRERIRHIPVKNTGETIVGILSDRDLQRAMEPDFGPAGTKDIRFSFNPAFKVRDFMSYPVRRISRFRPVSEAAQTMLDAKVSALMVTGSSGKIEGILTTDDLIRMLVDVLSKEQVSDSRETLVEALVTALGAETRAS